MSIEYINSTFKILKYHLLQLFKCTMFSVGISFIIFAYDTMCKESVNNKHINLNPCFNTRMSRRERFGICKDRSFFATVANKLNCFFMKLILKANRRV